DLSVADLARVGALLDRFDHAVEHVVLDRGFHLHLRKEVHDVLGAAVELGVALLPPESLHLGHCDALHADGREGIAHLVELERLDDCRDQFHFRSPRWRLMGTSTSRMRPGGPCSSPCPSRCRGTPRRRCPCSSRRRSTLRRSPTSPPASTPCTRAGCCGGS